MELGSVFDRVTEAGGVRSTLAAAARAARAIAAAGEDPAARAAADPNGAMTHSWLFTGPPGSGRSVAAEAFAQALLCTDPNTIGCGHCQGCNTAKEGTHAEVQLAVTDSTIIGVDYTRTEVVRWAYALPTTGEWRVVIMPQADRLSPEAANALLKAVEEPPKRTVFLLCAPTTDPEDFSVTLRSRCRHVYVPTPTIEEVVAELQRDNAGLTAEQAEWAGTVANGHIGRAKALAKEEPRRNWRAQALELVEGVFDPSRSYLLTRKLADAAAKEAVQQLEGTERDEMDELTTSLGVGAKGKGLSKSNREATAAIKALEAEHKKRRKRKTLDEVDLALLDMVGLLRDALLLASGVDAEGSNRGDGVPSLINVDRKRTSQEIARRVPPEGIVACIDAVMEARKAMPRNVRPAVALDGMMGAMQVACRVGQR